ncbi:PilW family protein [Pseudomonas sp. NPDC090202]|uniref:PilW family protein n=1 Tax=unclassified Pseudomonas TaxID=196821 RepID=UPI00381E1232
MKRSSAGFGLVEIMLALLLGLILSLALTQVFLSSKNTWLSQTSSAALQEDARFVLAKMLQEIRLAGVPRCLAEVEDATSGAFSSALQQPVHWDAARQALTLIGAAAGPDTTWHTWTLHTDCTRFAAAYHRSKTPKLQPNEFAIPIYKRIYRFNKARNELALDGQPLISNVKAFSVLFGVADAAGEPGIARYATHADPALIRSVRLSLTLFDPANRAREQTFDVVATLRNRLG